jgi:hypothetical protein
VEEGQMTTKELIELLRKEDPNAIVIKWNGRAYAAASRVTSVDRVSTEKRKPAIMIE